MNQFGKQINETVRGGRRSGLLILIMSAALMLGGCSAPSETSSRGYFADSDAFGCRESDFGDVIDRSNDQNAYWAYCAARCLNYLDKRTSRADWDLASLLLNESVFDQSPGDAITVAKRLSAYRKTNCIYVAVNDNNRSDKLNQLFAELRNGRPVIAFGPSNKSLSAFVFPVVIVGAKPFKDPTSGMPILSGLPISLLLGLPDIGLVEERSGPEPAKLYRQIHGFIQFDQSIPPN